MALTPAEQQRRNGQLARVEVGAVAQVLHPVVPLDEVGHADPGDALVAHAGHSGDLAHPLGIHQQGHGVAADAGADQGAVGHTWVLRLWGQPEQKKGLCRTAEAGQGRAGGPRRAG